MAKRLLPSLADIKKLIGDNYDLFVATIQGKQYQDAAPNNIAAGTGGAIPVTNYLTTINVDAGGDAFTIAAGTNAGQMKMIRLLATAGGAATITGTFVGGGTLTLDNANEFALLRWNGTAWRMIDNVGAAITA